MFIFQLFLGNTVVHTAVKHTLWRSISARYIRFNPRTYVDTVCMRVEVYGRQSSEPDPGKSMRTGAICTFVFKGGGGEGGLKLNVVGV